MENPKVNFLLEGLCPYRETKFKTPPKEDYCVWNDSKNTYGADNKNLVVEHNISIELYEYSPNDDLEESIEARFDDLAIFYDKQERYWLDSEKLFQIVYEFTYLEKKGVNKQ